MIKELSVKKLLKSLGWRLWPQHFANQYLADDKSAEIEEAIVPIFLSKTTDVVDVGANRGRYTVLMSVFSQHVHAFEPNPDCIARLEEIGLPNASIYPHALSSSPGVSEYFVAVQEGKQMSIWGTLEQSVVEKHQEVDVLSVSKSTLDELCDQSISFIKIDVEGHEIDVLEGGRQLISAQKPVVMVEAEERHRKGAVQQIKDFFEPYGYQGFFVLDRQVLPFASFDQAYQDPQALQAPVPRAQMRYVNNFLFIPSSDNIPSILEQMKTRLSSLSED